MEHGLVDAGLGLCATWFRATLAVPRAVVAPLHVVRSAAHQGAWAAAPLFLCTLGGTGLLLYGTADLPGELLRQQLLLTLGIGHGLPAVTAGALFIGASTPDTADPGRALLGGVLAGLLLWALACVGVLGGSILIDVVAEDADPWAWVRMVQDAVQRTQLVLGVTKSATFGAVLATSALIHDRRVLGIGACALVEACTSLPLLLEPMRSLP